MRVFGKRFFFVGKGILTYSNALMFVAQSACAAERLAREAKARE